MSKDKLNITKVEEPLIKPPTIEVDEKLLADAKHQIQFEKQVIVHCYFKVPFMCHSIRIRPNTYLKSKEGIIISDLITAFNISFYPYWSKIQSGMLAEFSLCFMGFDVKKYKSFMVFEDIPKFGFYSSYLATNDSNVYTTELFV